VKKIDGQESEIGMSSKFINPNRETPFMFPPSVEDWLPVDHLARFIVDIVKRLDLSDICSSYSEQMKGQKAYEPAMMVSLIFYCLITGILSSRKMERATWESIPVRYITGNLHPDHDTIASFRNRMKNALDDIFLKILLIAQEMGLLKLGTVSLDGTKMKANASKHKALSYKHACRLEEQLKRELEQLLAQSETEEAADAKKPEYNIPEEIHRREERLAGIERAKAEISRRERERYEKEKAEYEAKMKAREAKEMETGKKARGKAPKEPEEEISSKAQTNMTDKESRIMPKEKGAFECFWPSRVHRKWHSMVAD
jgi:transposase